MKLVRVRAPLVLGLTPLALLVACSLTTSLDGLSGGANDSGPGSATDAPASDAMILADAMTNETGNDAGLVPDDAPPVPFCDSLGIKLTFCDDFERTDPQGPWDQALRNGGGTLGIAPSTRAPAAGHELVASIAVVASGTVSLANLVRTLGDAQQVTVSYALRIEAAPMTGAQQVMLIGVNPFDKPADFFHTYLYVSQTDVTLVEETFPSASGSMNTFVQKPLSPPVLFGVWQRIEMTVKLSSPPRITVKVDDKVAFDGVPDASSFYRPGNANVVGGIHYSNSPSGPLALHFDDLYAVVQ